MSKKCLVFGCRNHTHQGTFIGDLCAPCYHYLTTGNVGPTDSFLRNIAPKPPLQIACPQVSYAPLHGERFDDDIDSIVQDFLNNLDDEVVFPYDLDIHEGEYSLQPASHYLDPDVVIENMQEQAGEECGDVAEDWLSGLSKVQIADLLANVDRWAGRWGLHPRFYNITRTRKVTIVVLNEDGDWKWKETPAS